MKKLKQIYPVFSFLIAVALVQGCSNNQSEKNSPVSGQSDLTVSVSDLYWGTRDVGVESTQQFVLTNRSPSKIRVNSIDLQGINASEFDTNLAAAITLEVGEAIQLAVTFAPQSEGRKYASMQIDYDRL